jgi:hypothetical protein
MECGDSHIGRDDLLPGASGMRSRCNHQSSFVNPRGGTHRVTGGRCDYRPADGNPASGSASRQEISQDCRSPSEPQAMGGDTASVLGGEPRLFPPAGRMHSMAPQRAARRLARVDAPVQELLIMARNPREISGIRVKEGGDDECGRH